MNGGDNLLLTNGTQQSLTVRDIVRVGFRRKSVFLIIFGLVFLLSVVYALVSSPKYEAETKILVRQGRADPVVSPTATAPLTTRQPLSQEELNSEVEILLSEDVLRQVVTASGLDRPATRSWLPAWLYKSESPAYRTDVAVRTLKSQLKVTPVKKTSVIEVKYRAQSAQQAAQVLRTLNTAYVQKHVEAHRAGGELKFFEQQAESYREKLRVAEERLQDFSKAQNSVRPDMVRDEMLQQLTALNGEISQTGVQIAQVTTRLTTLESEAARVPARQTTVMKSADNEQLMQQLKNTLLTLELKRSDLLSKYQEDYRPVQEVQREIDKTRATIAAENAAPLRETTTDVDPTHSLIATELTKSKTELSGLKARQSAMRSTVHQYETAIHDLENKNRLEQDLVREIKAAEENYLLYVQKREQSRISEALDQMRILNIAVVEEPTVPGLPVRPRWFIAVVGLFLAAVVSTIAVFVRDFLDTSFHAPHEIEGTLHIPVLAAVPRFSDGHALRNGDHVRSLKSFPPRQAANQ